jgi:hypothetical protein
MKTDSEREGGVMAENVTREDIAEMIEFVRGELSNREFGGHESEYVASARRSLAIAEKLPALVAERDALKEERDDARRLATNALSQAQDWRHSAETARETIANLLEALANISCGCGTTCMLMMPKEACAHHAATKALAHLDALPSPTRRAAAVSRALFRDAEAGACGEKVENATGHTDLMISPEAIDEALAANPLPDELANIAPPLTIDYTNWRGERRVRDILPLRIFFGSNEWHKEPQWLLEAVDPEDGKTKTFAFAGIHGFGEDNRLANAERTIAEAVEIMRPFAESAATYGGYLDEDDCDNAGTITVTSLSAARAFVEKHGGAK